MLEPLITNRKLSNKGKLAELERYESELRALNDFLSQKMNIIMGGRHTDYFETQTAKESARGEAYWQWYHPAINSVKFLKAVTSEINRIKTTGDEGRLER